MALTSVAEVHRLRREWQRSREWEEALMRLSREQGFPFWVSGGTILEGWVLAEQGQWQEGITQLRQGLAALHAIGTEQYRPSLLVMLAEAYGEVGQPEEGLSVLAEARAVVRNGRRMYEAELYRLKGMLTLQSKVQSPKSKVEKEAEEYFQKAIEVARCQSAKAWELRATMSLSRLRQSQGKKEEARRMLTEIYNWFTEGFDTQDLQEAKVLLDELT
jgi:predicted ATPase